MLSLETNRLKIRTFREGDWPALQELAVAYQATEAARYEDPWPTSADGARGMVSAFAMGDEYLAVCLKDIGKLIGLVAIDRRWDLDGCVHNLGYVFHPAYKGHGYATEACRAAMAHVFGALAADRIVTGTHPENRASVRLLERLDFERVRAPGEYYITSTEWKALETSRLGAAE